MENLSETPFNPQDDLKASNELMKLKLELEHNMMMSDTSGLPPEVENQWLNNIYNFEKHFKEVGRAKVYDLLGRPSFIKYDVLTESQVHQELLRLLALMAEKRIALDCCCEYPEVVIYRFLTEELFEHEADAFFMEGMVHHFLYEEFHPNHDYDLRRQATRFFERILSKEWDEEYDSFMLTKLVSFRHSEHTRESISSIVLAFQEAHTHLEVEEIQIENVSIEVENCRGSVEAQLTYHATPTHGVRRLIKGKCGIDFTNENEYWSIRSFTFPGFGSSAEA